MHCHLDLYPNPQRIVEECIGRGTFVLSVTTTPKAWHGTSMLVQGKSRIRTALGLHPQIAHQRFHELDLFDSLISETRYIGEIGLDSSKGFEEYQSIQLKAFRHILCTVNRAGGKIMTIHCRGCVSSVLDELQNIDGLPILHWFTGTPCELDRAINMGCWFSVGPSMLSTKKGQSLVLKIPKSRILTETDGPFGTFQKTPLMPWESEIAEKQLASLWRENLVDVKAQMLTNFKTLCQL